MERVTLDGEGFPHCQRFAVGVDGDLVVQQSLVHDEGVQSLRVGPADTQPAEVLHLFNVSVVRQYSHDSHFIYQNKTTHRPDRRLIPRLQRDLYQDLLIVCLFS